LKTGLSDLEQEIIRLTKAGRPFAWQADKLGISINQVRKVALDHKLIRFEPLNHTNGYLKSLERHGSENAATEAKALLGKRYQEKNGSMWLDGRPASIGDIMRAANRIQVYCGREQLGKNPLWHVKPYVEQITADDFV
jgi:hypothetical protein